MVFPLTVRCKGMVWYNNTLVNIKRYYYTIKYLIIMPYESFTVCDFLFPKIVAVV